MRVLKLLRLMWFYLIGFRMFLGREFDLFVNFLRKKYKSSSWKKKVREIQYDVWSLSRIHEAEKYMSTTSEKWDRINLSQERLKEIRELAQHRFTNVPIVFTDEEYVYLNKIGARVDGKPDSSVMIEIDGVYYPKDSL